MEQSKKKYDEKIKELSAKKIALFKKGDVKLWKCNEEEVDEAKSYKTDFEMAKRFILPKVFLEFSVYTFLGILGMPEQERRMGVLHPAVPQGDQARDDAQLRHGQGDLRQLR